MPAFQAGYEGSIPFSCSVKLQQTVHCYDLNALHAGVAQLVARLLAMQKVCGFEPRHLLTVEQFTAIIQMFAKRITLYSYQGPYI